MEDKEQLYLINMQINASIIFIITIVINIYLSINEREIIKNNKELISKKDKKTINIINRITIICLLIIYLYIAYKQKKIDESKGKQTNADNIEIIVSISSLIGGLLVLYEIYKYGDNEANLESPNA